MKRLFDTVFTLAVLVFVSPVLFIAALVVLKELGRPVLFKQRRPGLNGQPFTILKFRTMTDAKDSAGLLLSDAERMVPVGKFLRKTSLDELPTLWNVLKGDMSIVGPRPLLMQYLSRYSSEQMRRHEVKPGITGWAQVNGRNAISWEEKFKLDVWYVDNQSLWLDLKIIGFTVLKVLKREGISAAGEATMSEFMGAEKTNAG